MVRPGLMRLRPDVIKVALMRVSLRDVPIAEWTGQRQRVSGSMVVARSIAFEACPDAVGMFPIYLLTGPAGRVYSHAKCLHEPLQPALRSNPIKVIRIGPAPSLKQVIGVSPVPFVSV